MQNAADAYNERLLKEQESIRTRQEQEQSQKDAFVVPVVLGGVVLVLVMVIRLSALVSEPPAFTVSDKGVSLKTNVLKEAQHIPLEDIDRIHYEITRERFTDGEGNTSYRFKRILYFDGEKNKTLGLIDLNILEGAHFNTIYQEISRKAPHIKWVFPE